MLLELEIANFAIIDQLRVQLAPGLNVLTGETGAGKSILIDAVGQLLGDRAEPDMVRSGVDRAVIQGVFQFVQPDTGGVQDRLVSALQEHGIEYDEQLILVREIYAEGRSLGRINARAVPIRALAQVGECLVDIHGQSEHLSLRREAEHLELLDRYAGLLDRRQAVHRLVDDLQRTRAQLSELQRDEREVARRAELLRFQVDEIEAADLQPGEDERLQLERRRLANAEKLATLAEQAYVALLGDDSDVPGVVDGLAAASASLDDLCAIDPALAQVSESVQDLCERLQDVGRHLRDYRDGIDFSASQLEAIEERAQLIFELKRKYGESLEQVMAWAQRARAELDSLTHSVERLDALQRHEDELLRQIGAAAAELSHARSTAAKRLAAAVEAGIKELGMGRTTFQPELSTADDPDGVPVGDRRLAFSWRGVDRVAFQLSTNPGQPLRPLARVASGGETSRLMLALKSALSQVDQTPTLIFDEIDIGIGGRVGSVVGSKLWSLARRHQVLCVTHLAQVAAFADRHIQVTKDVRDGRVSTSVQAVEDGQRVVELAHMLGGDSVAGRDHARELLRRTEEWKAKLTESNIGHSGSRSRA
jgi:DNA repair protein RecN (Recombination protein N)